MKFDVILLSYSKTPTQVKTTQDCIKSLIRAKNKIGVNIFVVESYNPDIKFKGAETHFYKKKEFNYNQSMNFAFTLTKEKYVFFANNDLEFFDGWADACYHVFRMGYASLSPYCPVTHPRFTKDGKFLLQGYRVGFHVAGWCIGVDRTMFKKLGGFNEAVTFWYSDNLYAEQLKLADVKHCLVCNSFVKHLGFGSKTLNSLTPQEKAKLTSRQRKVFNKEVKRLYDAEAKKSVHRHP